MDSTGDACWVKKQSSTRGLWLGDFSTQVVILQLEKQMRSPGEMICPSLGKMNKQRLASMFQQLERPGGSSQVPGGDIEDMRVP